MKKQFLKSMLVLSERQIRLGLVWILIVFIPGILVVAWPDILKINLSDEWIFFVIIFMIISLPFIFTFKDKTSSFKNVAPNLKKFVDEESIEKSSFPILKLATIIFSMVFIGQLLVLILGLLYYE